MIEWIPDHPASYDMGNSIENLRRDLVSEVLSGAAAVGATSNQRRVDSSSSGSGSGSASGSSGGSSKRRRR
jgi:hypothetical protein